MADKDWIVYVDFRVGFRAYGNSVADASLDASSAVREVEERLSEIGQSVTRKRVMVRAMDDDEPDGDS